MTTNKGLSVCKFCHEPIDMNVIGSSRVLAHDRTFCSMKCALAWDQDPDNAEFVSKSHEEARDLGLPYEEAKIRK